MYVGRCGVGGVESQPTFLVSRGFAPANWILTKRQAHWCAKAAKHSANHFQKRTPQIHYLSMYVCRYIFFRNNPRQKHCWIRIRGRGPGASKYEARRAGDEMCLVRRPRALPGGGGLFIHYSHATYQIMARLCTVRFLSAVRARALPGPAYSYPR